MKKSLSINRATLPFVTVIGTGEAFSSEFGNTAYLLQGGGLPTVLFDCGYQVPERLWKSDLHGNIDAICLTHLHADHCFGIVPLLMRYWEEKRSKPLTIIGGRGTERFLKKLMEMGYPGIHSRLSFPLRFLYFSESKTIRFEGVKFSVARTVHSVINYTVRVDFDRPAIQSFAVSGDGQITRETKSLVEDVDLLLQEIYTLSECIPVHADLRTFEAWIFGAQVSKVGVAHHARTEVTRISRRTRALAKKDPRWFVLKPGQRISLAKRTASKG